MFNKRKLSYAAAATTLTLAGAAFVLLAASAEPAMALCKYGTPHCVNPHPGPAAPKVGGATIPDSGWEDPDCKYYGSCGVGSTPENWGDPAALRKLPLKRPPARYGSAQPVAAASMKVR
jgi:hypothetical protein